MSRFIHETPRPEKLAPDKSAVADDRLPHIDEASKERSNCRPLSPSSGRSFLTILLRALSAWTD